MYQRRTTTMTNRSGTAAEHRLFCTSTVACTAIWLAVAHANQASDFDAPPIQLAQRPAQNGNALEGRWTEVRSDGRGGKTIVIDRGTITETADGSSESGRIRVNGNRVTFLFGGDAESFGFQVTNNGARLNFSDARTGRPIQRFYWTRPATAAPPSSPSTPPAAAQPRVPPIPAGPRPPQNPPAMQNPRPGNPPVTAEQRRLRAEARRTANYLNQIRRNPAAYRQMHRSLGDNDVRPMPALVWNEALRTAAERRAAYMARTGEVALTMTIEGRRVGTNQWMREAGYALEDLIRNEDSNFEVIATSRNNPDPGINAIQQFLFEGKDGPRARPILGRNFWEKCQDVGVGIAQDANGETFVSIVLGFSPAPPSIAANPSAPAPSGPASSNPAPAVPNRPSPPRNQPGRPPLTSDTAAMPPDVSPPPETRIVRMPSIIGLTREEAHQRLSDLGLDLRILAYAADNPDENTTEEVVRQNPEAGTRLVARTTVRFHHLRHPSVSTGVDYVRVPHVEGMTASAATRALEGAGLTVKVTLPEAQQEWGNQIPGSELIAGQDPATSTQVRKGTEVSLSVRMAAVPDLFQMTEQEADAALRELGFVPSKGINTTTEPLQSHLNNRSTAQFPAANTRMPTGYQVTYNLLRSTHVIPASPQPPAAQESPRSRESNINVHASWKNTEPVPIQMYWIGFDGQPSEPGTIQPGATVQGGSFATHVYVFKKGNRQIRVVTLSDEPRQHYDIKDKWGPKESGSNDGPINLFPEQFAAPRRLVVPMDDGLRIASRAVALIVKGGLPEETGVGGVTRSGLGTSRQAGSFVFGDTSGHSIKYYHHHGTWKMTFLVASDENTVVIAFRGTDKAITVGDADIYVDNDAGRAGENDVLHSVLNGQEPTRTYGQPYGAGFGYEDLQLRLQKSDRTRITDNFDKLVHPGWALAALDCLEAVRIELNGRRAEEKRIIVCGHSMGGNVATYLTYLLLNNEDGERAIPNNGKQHRLVTFGTPKSGIFRYFTAATDFSARSWIGDGFIERTEDFGEMDFLILNCEIDEDTIPTAWRDTMVNDTDGQHLFKWYAFGNVLTFREPSDSSSAHAYGTYYKAVSDPDRWLSKVPYRLYVKTADESLAGTDANLTLTISGDNSRQTTPTVINPLFTDISGAFAGTTPMRWIRHVFDDNAFEENDYDVAQLVDGTYVRQVTRITLRSDRAGGNSDWKLDSFKLRPIGTGVSYTFRANTWIEDQANDTYTLTNPVTAND